MVVEQASWLWSCLSWMLYAACAQGPTGNSWRLKGRPCPFENVLSVPDAQVEFDMTLRWIASASLASR